LLLKKRCSLEKGSSIAPIDNAVRAIKISICVHHYVALHTISIATEKANFDDKVTVDEKISNGNDIQGSEGNCSQEQEQSRMTNNSIF
jgi:hypothetical protein